MAKELKIRFVLTLLVANFILTTCVSMGVSIYGKDYFIDKPEKSLTKYFGAAMKEFDDTEGQYDKVISCNNEVITATMTRRNVKQYKVEKRTKLWDFTYSKYNDGCYTYGNKRHYETSDDGSVITAHNNFINYVNDQIAFFNNQVERLGCIALKYQQDYFNKSNIGDVFYVSSVYDGNGKRYYGETDGIIPPHSYQIFSLAIYKVEVIAENEVKTETVTAWTFYGNTGEYYDINGAVISEQSANNIFENYKKQGFEPNGKSTGLSLTAYIKDGKIIKVE
jgi:hypothetical protein